MSSAHQPSHLAVSYQTMRAWVSAAMARVGALWRATSRPSDQAQQLAERRLVVGEGREDVDVVVDQGRQQHVARMVEHELRAPVGRPDDIFVALEDHLRRRAPVAGVG
jgi:hypothetical protein